ncbi:MAG: helix-turn-helix transcriptional regulator [Armatimonadota bacterium]|nr:helix-turn-helix transcriptional regulator [Armatimonadota bacterium]MDR7485255.1 helix-turn-helix transcriptional regulator [Armatimonadota bacterium]MDR7533907.1 helix-turn-helix transcriptional regulator [Armatimonadota bacterium]MDR7537131.1 helix-turn-helix transcriptional regulator [Armatimonadota bacterium]
MPEAIARARTPRSRLDFGRAVETLRTSRALSRDDLARIARISRSYVQDVERGRKRPSADIVARIARALGLSVAAFMQYVEEISAPPADEDRPVAVQLPLRRGRGLPLFEADAPAPAAARAAPPLDRNALAVAELQVIVRRLTPADRSILLQLARYLLSCR